ncbi:isoleucine--tRNA ligase, cytoplasmic [Copidosoma floridanum]|uniref:isoleucine--tRNA ligase, cytoplasmic n=1 Tax=Copidosoma floridanum TaxID=29053 RepID=UPI0006C9A760|nr:isoleucine--tRNA ligase, cytoplasmic [Copidosoma floridanum]XP_023246139.1 isoleucine--tRNA ligase, cytoplasmic [Copidosoma floridanum]
MESINFPEEEQVILELWKKLDVFNNCLKQSKGKPRYSFYDGPPFATGLPHYGHILAGTIKDVVTRYAHQRGYHVERRFGWDTHGLPVEFEIDKALNIKGPDDVMKMGIANYNKECRSIVMRYASEWEKIVGRLGRWIDFKNDYKTLYPWYMESIWWVFKQLYDKGLVYQGVKVMPYSTVCNTPLSNFESGQNYKDVVDPAVVISFPLLDEPNVSMLAWTTTPWTLPSNLALCCNPDFEYVDVLDHETGKIFVLLESRLEEVYKSNDLYTIKRKRKGSDLLGKSYEPLFPYFSHLREKGAFRVLNDKYVGADSGTGVVHQAPYFGEDDYRCCLQAGVITKDQEIVCPVDNRGCFTEPVKDFLGKHVKDADKEIIKYLRLKGRLIKNDTKKHSYPFCWRSDTPLIYKAVPSWFIRVESFKDKLLETNAQTHWVPDYVKEKRFGNWLKEARDWAISRNRYWGNPIPIWISEDRKEVVCVGSIAELEKLTGKKITDIHRENIDDLKIPSKRPGCPPLSRVPEVFDCWFESGSMPYAQVHYPFERTKEFEESFPADFVAEGIDQTRGWFYTLLVISTALFGKPPFKNLIANGLILASDGQKMSKRKKNYPDPMEVVNKYGADALRLYLINSPVVRAENLRFKEEGVRDVIKDVFLPWYNAFRFLIQNIERFEHEERCNFVYKGVQGNESSNVMDRWIISFTETLLQFLKNEMQAYRLYTVVPKLVKYIDNLTNWYVRMNRRRIKGDTGSKEDCQLALNTLFRVVYMMVRINAPFTPFLAEFMYQKLRRYLSSDSPAAELASVHYHMIPEACASLVDEPTERAVACMQTVIELGRIVRDRKTLPVKYPLPEIVVIHQDAEVLTELLTLKSYILEELNVKELTVTTDKSKYGVQLRAEPDHKSLGARLKSDFKSVGVAIRELSDEQLQAFVATQRIEVNGHELTEQDLRLMFKFEGPAAEQLAKRYEAHSEANVLVLLDITPDESMKDEGLAREVINRVQKLRKKAKLVPLDEAIVYYEITATAADAPDIARIIVSHQEFIETTTKTPQKHVRDMPANTKPVLEETSNIKGAELHLLLVRVSTGNQTPDAPSATGDASQPFSTYVNVQLHGSIQPRYGATSRIGTILLESAGARITDCAQLKAEINKIFGIYGCHYGLFIEGKQVDKSTKISSLNGALVSVVKIGDEPPSTEPVLKQPACRFINVQGKESKGTVLLENPQGNFILSQESLKKRLGLFYKNSNLLLPPVDTLKLHGFIIQTTP